MREEELVGRGTKGVEKESLVVREEVVCMKVDAGAT